MRDFSLKLLHFGFLAARIIPLDHNRNDSIIVFALIHGGTMQRLKSNFLFLTRYIRNLRGGSQPILAEASDGLLYVIKYINNLQGPNLLFNESAGSELFHANALAVPNWMPIFISDSFLDHNPDSWMQTPTGRLRPVSGLCFGSRFLGGDDIRILEILPGTSFLRVRNRESFWLAWMIDICANHADNRQAIFDEDAEGWLNAHFVDSGHLFGGPKGELHLPFLASRYLDPRIYQSISSKQQRNIRAVAGSIDMDQLWQRIHTLSDDWTTAALFESFAECLDKLSNANLLRNILDTMVDAVQRTGEFEQDRQQNGRKLPEKILYIGVQAAGGERRRIAGRFDYPACA
jgi:hypothetical protein